MPADACRVPADDAGGRRMLCRAMADGLRWAGGYRVVNWRADGMQRADGCGAGARGWHAARWRMLCREPPDVVPCVADGLWRVGGWRRGSKDGAPEASGWCVKGRRVANRRRLGAIFSPLEL